MVNRDIQKKEEGYLRMLSLNMKKFMEIKVLNFAKKNQKKKRKNPNLKEELNFRQLQNIVEIELKIYHLKF